MTERLYRQSDIGAFLWCRRNYWFSVNRRLKPLYPPGGAVPVNATALGSLCHDGVYWAAQGEDPVPHMTALARELCWPDDIGHTLNAEWSKVLDYATFMVLGWKDWVEESGVEVGIETIEREERMYVPLGEFSGDNVTLTMAPDRVMVDHGLGGAIIIDDIKTVAGNDLGTVQTHNRQLMTYAIGWRILKNQVPRYLSTTQLGKSKRTKGGSLNQYFHRSQLYITDEMYSSHFDELYVCIDEMVKLDQALDRGDTRPAVQNPGRDCGWKCRFQDPCITYNYGGDVETLLITDYRKTEVETNG